jgi:uncharacterized membrane protein YphA (DoxX/SURF4 family)
MNKWTKACLVALRIAVGWHFLYEGVYKIGSDSGSTDYTTARFTLQAATGRLHDYFAAGQFTRAEALQRADAWYDEIVKGFAVRKQLDEGQKARLGELRDKVKLAALASLRGEGEPGDVVSFDWGYVHEEVLKIAAAPEGERFTSLGYLQASAGPMRGAFRALVPDMDGLERLTAASAGAALDRRYGEILEHFQAAGKPFTAEQEKRLAAARDAVKASTTVILGEPVFQARLADYGAMRARTAADAGGLTAQFSRERLDADRKKLDVMAGEMLACVNEPLSELAAQMQQIASVDQLGTGPVRRPGEPAGWIDKAIEWGLTAIGVCLLLGLFTPVAAMAAAGQLLVFYFASPPWPGLPATSMAGHYMYIDRNFIEMIAALVVAGTPTGVWAGLDFYLDRLWRRRRAAAAPVEEKERELALVQ